MKKTKLLQSRNSYLLFGVLLVVVVSGVIYFLRGVEDRPMQTGLLPANIGKIVNITPSNILIKFKSSASAERRASVLSKHNLKEKSEIKQLGIKVVSLLPGQSPQALASRVMDNESDSVEFAEPDYIVDPSLIPNDPWYVNWQKDKAQINAPTAWNVTTGNSSVVLAVVDTGVNCSHEDLSGQCVAGWNFYDNNADTSDVFGHGTAVAGVAAAVGNNGLGMAGMVWQAKIMPLRVSASNGTASYSTIANAIVYAADNGARVVNNSYQTSGSSTVRTAAGYLKNHGGLLVVSEGNYGANTGYTNSPNLISVSAVDVNDNLYSWSSFGDDVDVSAPGCTGATTANNGGYTSFCGTSNAAPEVAGLLALMWSANPALTPDQIQNLLFQSARDLGSTGWDQSYGWGRIDAGAAFGFISPPVIQNSPTPLPTDSGSPAPSPTPTRKPNPGKKPLK